MQRYLFSFLLFGAVVTAQAQMRWNQQYQQYINQYKDLAIEQMQKYKIPASITLAQGIFESRGGQSRLALYGNNHFGIKCHGWEGRKVYADDDEANECFRAYDNPFQSYEDHSLFLANGRRYSNLFSLRITDYKGWARGLKAAGYATNPNYANQLIELIQLYKLYQYDTAKSYDKFIAERSKDRQPQRGVGLHQVFMYNANYYVMVRQGDTFQLLADELEISARKLARFNERDLHDRLEVGEIIYLKKKQKRASKDYKGRMHYIRPGESMYSIAQFYGIRLKYLYKMNHLDPDYQIRVGDALRIR